jgi:hypothetical protein
MVAIAGFRRGLRQRSRGDAWAPRAFLVALLEDLKHRLHQRHRLTPHQTAHILKGRSEFQQEENRAAGAARAVEITSQQQKQQQGHDLYREDN